MSGRPIGGEDASAGDLVDRLAFEEIVDLVIADAMGLLVGAQRSLVLEIGYGHLEHQLVRAPSCFASRRTQRLLKPASGRISAAPSLDEPTYRAVQAVYYPGFTIGGLVGEFGSMLLLAALLFFIPAGSGRFWWTAAALGFLLAGHAVYWAVTHPANNAWLKDTQLTGASKLFFGLLAAPDADWRHMRNVWEWSHVARACLATLGFIATALAAVR